jgi:hypothetical protein
MPYKNPEDKRRWEREHRAQRNTLRRAQRLGTMTPPRARNTAPDRVSGQEVKNGWKILLGLAIGFGVAILAALSGTRLRD